MLDLETILEKTRAKVKEMNPDDPNAALRSTQVQSLAAVLVDEINAALYKPICFGDTMQGVEDSMVETFAQEAEQPKGEPKKFMKFTHPKMSGYLITELNETRENVAENYIGDDVEPGDLEKFIMVEVEMTQDEFDELPEFEG